MKQRRAGSGFWEESFPHKTLCLFLVTKSCLSMFLDTVFVFSH